MILLAAWLLAVLWRASGRSDLGSAPTMLRLNLRSALCGAHAGEHKEDQKLQ